MCSSDLKWLITFTVTVSPTFGGVYVSPGNLINHFYQRTVTNGTVAWTRQPQAASNAIVQAGAGYTTAFEVLTSMISDPNAYIKVSAAGAGLVQAIPHDLNVGRKVANLEVLSA